MIVFFSLLIDLFSGHNVLKVFFKKEKLKSLICNCDQTKKPFSSFSYSCKVPPKREVLKACLTTSKWRHALIFDSPRLHKIQVLSWVVQWYFRLHFSLVADQRKKIHSFRKSYPLNRKNGLSRTFLWPQCANCQ